MNKTKETTRGFNSVYKSLLLMVLTWICFIAGQTACFAFNVQLNWDPALDQTTTIGYKVYYKSDASSPAFDGTGAVEGPSPVDVGNASSKIISGLDPAKTYSFVITAYDISTIESPFSDIVSLEAVPPAISLTNPANDALASGTVSVTADASDNVGVTSVEFYVNGVLQATNTSAPYMLSWNTTSLAAGAYLLMARAYDASGNIGQSSNVSVNVVKDTSAPMVSLTAPGNNTTVRGTTAITAGASDDIAVSKVEFYQSGVLLAATNVAPYTCNWNTTLLADGSYTLYAKAYDAAGNVKQSTSIAVTVSNDITAPTVSITAPAKSAKVSGTVSVTASASDNVKVSKVEFYVNGVLKATDTVSPYIYSWDTKSLADGSYTLSAKAYDAAGNVKQSTNVAVTVKNSTLMQ